MFKKLIKFSSIITFLFLFSLWTGKQAIFAQTTAVNNPESPHELTLEVDKMQAVANGVDTITVTATLKDRTTFEPLENPTQGTPMANVRLIFEVSGAGVNLNQPRQVTDSNGQIKAYLTATTAGEKTISVTDSSLNPATYETDYYQVSLSVTFAPIGTPTPLPSPTPTVTPTPTITPTPTPTPIPTPTPTPWQPVDDQIKTDPKNSDFTIEPWTVGVRETAIVKIDLKDADGNPVTDEIPYILVSGEGNTIIQPTLGVNSVGYFSSTVAGQKWVQVKVGRVYIGEPNTMRSFNVMSTPSGYPPQRVDLSLGNLPKDTLKIGTHGSPIYIHIPQGKQVDSVRAVMDCGGGGQKQISFVMESQNGGQIFRGDLYARGTQGLKCTLRILTEPPEEPDEPPPEIPVEPIDPFGVVYDAKTGEIVIGAVVTLYELQNGNWVIWDGTELEQVNPQTTDVSGLYSFWVYPGKYYLTVAKEGYDSFVSDVIEVIKEPVKLNVYLNPQSNIKLLLWALTLIVPLGFVVAVVFFWRRRKKQAAPPETQTVQN